MVVLLDCLLLSSVWGVTNMTKVLSRSLGPSFFHGNFLISQLISKLQTLLDFTCACVSIDAFYKC